LQSISLDNYDDSERSTSTEIFSNVATRVKDKFVDLVDGGITDEDEQSISSSEELWEESKSINNIAPVQVTPVRPDSESNKEDSPWLGNMYGLISMLTSPTAKKCGRVVECINESTQNKKLVVIVRRY